MTIVLPMTGPDSIRMALKGAEEVVVAPTANGPLPLFPPLAPPEPYPATALGPILSEAAQAIARKVQLPVAIAGQSVLAAAALAAQAHADVMLPYGQTRPLSLFFVTVAASGDRKSTGDNEALWPVRKREKALREEHEREILAWSVAHAAYAAEQRKIETDRKLDLASRRAALAALGPEPLTPLHPFLTAPEPTIEGLTKAWGAAPAAVGVFTAEGGQFVGGHALSDDNRLRSAAALSALWDGQPVTRIRAQDGVTVLCGRRLSMHLMVQPHVATQFLADPVLRDQGLLSRVLVAQPESLAGTRLYRDADPADDASIRTYGARLLSLLEAQWPMASGHRNELEPRCLFLTPEAAKQWKRFHDHVEAQCGPHGDLRAIRDFGAKVAEQAARIAGVLTIVADRHATTISANTMGSAVVLADWYVAEAARLAQAGRIDPALLLAQELLVWMRARREAVAGAASGIAFRDILQFGPAALRTKAAADKALSILTAHGWVFQISDRPRLLGLFEEK